MIVNTAGNLAGTVDGHALVEAASEGRSMHDIAGDGANEDCARETGGNPKHEPYCHVDETDLGRAQRQRNENCKHQRTQHLDRPDLEIVAADRLVHASRCQIQPVDECCHKRRKHDGGPGRRECAGRRIQCAWQQSARNHRTRLGNRNEVGSDLARPQSLGERQRVCRTGIGGSQAVVFERETVGHGTQPRTLRTRGSG